MHASHFLLLLFLRFCIAVQLNPIPQGIFPPVYEIDVVSKRITLGKGGVPVYDEPGSWAMCSWTLIDKILIDEL